MTHGVSPLLASVLVIAVTVGIGTLTMGFVSTTFQSAESTVTNRTTEASDCSSAEIVIDDAFAKTGDNGTVAVPVRNSGFSDLQITSAQLYDRLGNNFSASNLPVTGFSKGSIVNLNFQMPKLPNTTVDSSGKGNNGTCVWMGSGSANTTCSFMLPGKSGSAMSFDGVDSQILITDKGAGDPLRINTSLTIMAWINPATDPLLTTIVNKHQGSGDTIGGYILSTNSSRIFGYYNNVTTQASINGSITLSTGAWQHAAMTYNGSNVSLYVNAIFDNSTTHRNFSVTEQPFTIGSDNDGGITAPFNGDIDEVAIWNRSLTANEINTSMNFGPLSVSNTNDLIGYWRFDEGRGILSCDDLSSVIVTTNCGGISATFDRMPRCS